MPKTLLLADDSVTIQKVVGISFANEDVVLVTVDNGDDAIARTRETRPDIVLADVVMPGMNGYEVCQAIKSDSMLRHIPVLLLTGTFEAFDAERAARVGADGHITKPFEAQALVDQVNARLAAASAPSDDAPIPAPPRPTSFEDSLGLHSAAPLSPGSGESFDFFDEEITEPRGESGPAYESRPISSEGDFSVGADADDAFAFEAQGDLDELSALSPSDSPRVESAPGPESMNPWVEAETGPDRTVAILPDSDAFASAPTEPPTAPPTLGEADLTQLDPPRASEKPTSSLKDLSSDLPAQPVPTRILQESTTPYGTASAPLAADSFAPGETMILSDLDTDPLGDEHAVDDFESPELHSAEGFSADALTHVEPDDLAAEAVLDPVGSRDFDVSSSDLGVPPQEQLSADPEAERELSSPWPVEPPAGAAAGALAGPAHEGAPVSPVTREADAPSASTGAGPDLAPFKRQQLHDALEKIAWEAFSDVAEQIVKDAVERIEKVAWEVIPQMAEALIQEEIRKLKGEDN